METKHYIVDKNNIEECQKHFYKKGYKWNRFDDGVIWNPIELYNEDEVIINIDVKYKTIGWDFYHPEMYKNIIKFSDLRKHKLKRILDEERKD